MATYWFISAPLVSHTDWGGFLKTALALKARGQTVIWVSGNQIGGGITRAGLEFAPIYTTGWLWPPPPAPDVESLPPQEAVMLRYRRALDTWLHEDLVGEAVAALIELAGQIGKPDVIVTDPFLSAAALAAEHFDIPLVVCGWVAQDALNAEHLFPVQRELGSESQGRIERLNARFGLTGRYFADGPTPSILSPQLHVSYFSKTWYQADSASLLPQTLFVGGAPTPPVGDPPVWLTDIPEDRAIALITLGTVFTGDLGFFAWAAQAAARVGYIPLVVVGFNPISPDQKSELVRSLPRTTRLLNFVDFDHALPRVQLMVHHGGMGTTHAALVHGIPQIAVPHAADQRGQARRIAQAKVGLNLSAHDVRQGMLLDGIKAITFDEKVQQNARDLAAELAALGGAEAAADAISKVVTTP